MKLRFWVILILAFCNGFIAAQKVVKVMTYNTQGKMGVEKLTNLIKESGAAIVGLQETISHNSTHNNNLYAAELEWNVVYPGMDTPHLTAPDGWDTDWWVGGHHMQTSMLTKYEVVEYQFYNIEGVEDDWIDAGIVECYRSCLRARLKVEEDLYINVFVLHANPWERSWHIREISDAVGQLNNYYPDDPTLIIGDFNTLSHLDGAGTTESTQYLQEHGFIDTYRYIHQDYNTHPGISNEDGRIDYVYVRNAEVLNSLLVENGVYGSGGYNDSDHLAVVSVISAGSVSDIEDEGNTPECYKVYQNYPNPFNPETTIRFSIPEYAFVSLKVYDVLGREVANLISDKLKSGTHTIKFNGNDLSSGIYFCRLFMKGKVSTIKMAFNK